MRIDNVVIKINRPIPSRNKNSVKYGTGKDSKVSKLQGTNTFIL